MQRRDPHPRNFSEVLHTKRFRIVRRDPRDCFCRAVALLSKGGDRPQTGSLVASKQTVDDLALNKTPKKRRVLGRFQQSEQAAACIEKFHASHAGGYGRAFGWGLSHMNLFATEKFTNYRDLDFE